MHSNDWVVSATHLMSSSLAKMMTPRALEVSISRLMILSNSPGFGSLGIFIDCAIHRPPNAETLKMCFHLTTVNFEAFLYL